jgi:hypothetical protein
LLSGSAVLIKQTGIYIPAAMIFLLLAVNRKKTAFFVVISGALGLIVWLCYGYYYDWALFTRLLGVFSGREINLPMMAIHLFDTFRISEKAMSVDGLMIWGWVSVIVYSLVRKNKPGLSFSALPIIVGSYLVFFAIMSGHAKGWYRFPFHPFLAWAMSAVFLEIFNSPRFLMVYFFVTVPFFASLVSGTGEAFWNQAQVRLYQFTFLSFMAPFIFYELKKNLVPRSVLRLLLIAVFIGLISFNIRTIIFFQDQFWY